LNWKAGTAQEAIAKILKLSKLVISVSIRNIFMVGAIKDNIPDGSKIALVNTMALLDRDCEQVRFTEFKAAFRQTFANPPPLLRHILWPQGIAIKIPGQVLHSLASTLMTSVNLSFYLILGHSTAASESALLLRWGAT
jgi:hypothetical protein